MCQSFCVQCDTKICKVCLCCLGTMHNNRTDIKEYKLKFLSIRDQLRMRQRQRHTTPHTTPLCTAKAPSRFVCAESVPFEIVYRNEWRSSRRRQSQGSRNHFYIDWSYSIYRADMWLYLPEQRWPRRFWPVVWSWGK